MKYSIKNTVSKMSQLPSDCLNEIFEYLVGDKDTLRSCLLVNRLWCEVSVRILWRRIRNYNTLIACLPNDSKEILSKNEIVASRPPMFNYASFCKVLSTNQVNINIGRLLNQQYIKNLSIVTREIFKFLVSQTSLREIDLTPPSFENDHSQEFTSIPEVMGCLKNLSELSCNSDICSEFFYQLSRICPNLQFLDIEFVNVISNGLADLISVQQNLKVFNVVQINNCEGLTADIITSLSKLPDTLIKLDLYVVDHHIPLLFVAKLTNLQEIIISFDCHNFEEFKELQYITFSQLQVLKFQYEFPENGLLMKFLENNGKNLKEFYINDCDNSLNLVIANFCPNLRKLFTGFRNNEVETFKMILNNCQHLESIKIWCCDDYLNENELFEILVEHLPKNFYELKLCYHSFYEEFGVESELLPEELESFFIGWSDRMPQTSLSLTIIRNDSSITLDDIDDNMELIEDYIRLGIVKKFNTIEHYFDDYYD